MKSAAHHLKGKRGLPRLLSACVNTRDGFASAWKTEEAFRQEAALLAAGSAATMVVDLPATHRLALIGSIVLVMIVELLNSAIEAAIDRISLDIHPLSKVAKDIGSAAVALSIFLMLAVWGTLLYPALP